ncbi:response regulator transcription factor [Sinirhodobacter huangdaonensis]|jgi:DNA-binding response OmpR family regulator|uniref:Response regulator n=1 Tax=Paenirhodobacter huangdaonensis TaxID=2501515 RepID=A0A3S3MQ60_9RHOB|nr:response regulator [Sinirhodobacter huangdaonensis]RWR52094.1 response regulator [Sinirhodobacter huangdaonensis]
MAQRQVLLIEDEPHIAEAIRFILGRAGWQVMLEANGAQALARIAELRPEAVILDLMLPGRSGLEILTDLRADPRLAATPVLMLTARGQARDREAAEQAGATAFLAKPFANADVVAALEAIAGTGTPGGAAAAVAGPGQR